MTLAQEGILKTTRRAIMTFVLPSHFFSLKPMILMMSLVFLRKLNRSSRNTAVITTVGVVGGTVLFFNYLKAGQPVAKPEEHLAYNGRIADPSGQTDQGTAKSGRVRLKSYNER
jgi:hypothetical protein